MAVLMEASKMGLGLACFRLRVFKLYENHMSIECFFSIIFLKAG